MIICASFWDRLFSLAEYLYTNIYIRRFEYLVNVYLQDDSPNLPCTANGNWTEEPWNRCKIFVFPV